MFSHYQIWKIGNGEKTLMISKETSSLVSVVVPVYNVEAYLDKCIKSIVQQSYQNLEILLIDDGSSDRSREICDNWEMADARIRVFHKINAGLSAARNTGLDYARGEYLCFVDSDDFIEREMIKNLYEAAARTGACIVACNFVYEYEEDTEIIRKQEQVYQIHSEEVVSRQKLLHMMNNGLYTFGEIVCNKLWKKELFESIRYPIGKIHEDEYIFHQLIYKSSFIACIPYVGYHYLQHKNSIMHSHKNYQDAFEAIIERCYFFEKRDERELTIESEKRLLGLVKKAKSEGKIRKRDSLLKEYMRIVVRLYSKKWISLCVLCRRFIRIYIIW